MAYHIACHFFHGKPRQSGAARIQAFLQAKILNLFRDKHDLIHTFDRQIHPVILRNAETVRNHHQLLHVPRNTADFQARIEENRKQRDHTVQDVGNVQTVHAEAWNQQRRESGNAYNAVEDRKNMD